MRFHVPPTCKQKNQVIEKTCFAEGTILIYCLPYTLLRTNTLINKQAETME